jgi:hypothetical protein
MGEVTLGVPGAGWVLLPVLLFAMGRRRWLHASIILFVLPLSAVALLIYSGGGMTFYGIGHLIALAVAIDLLVGWNQARKGRLSVARSPVSTRMPPAPRPEAHRARAETPSA